MQKTLKSIKAHVDRVLAFFIIVCLVSLVAVVVWQVFSRYALHSPSTTTDELARYLMIDLAFLGTAYTAGMKQHLSMELFTNFLTRKIHPWFVSAIYHMAVMVFAITAMIYGGIGLIHATCHTGNISPMMQIPMSWAYVVIPVSGILMVFYSLTSLALEYFPSDKSDSTYE